MPYYSCCDKSVDVVNNNSDEHWLKLAPTERNSQFTADRNQENCLLLGASVEFIIIYH